MPPSASRIQQTPQETIPVDVFKGREQVNQPLEMEETNLKEGMDIQPAIVVSSTITGTGPIISPLLVLPDHVNFRIPLLIQQPKALEE